MTEFSLLVRQIIVQLPVLVVLVVGLILLITRRPAGRPGSLALAGVAVLGIGVLAGAAWTMSLPTFYRADWSPRELGLLASAVGLLLNLWQALGLGLLLAAAIAGGRQSRPG